MIPLMGETTEPSEITESSEAAPTPDYKQRNKIILAVVVTAVVAALVGFGVWKYNQPDITGLADGVRSSMNSELSSDTNLGQYNLQVDSVTVMHTNGDQYQGTATVRAGGGAPHSVLVHVTYDGKQMMWNTDPGAFTFAVFSASAPTTTSAAPQPITASKGTPVTDGSLQFVVKSISQTPTISTSFGATYTANGVYMIVDVTIANVGDAPATFQGINQKLIVGTEQYAYAGEPTFALQHNPTATINPGLSVSATIAFDVPVGVNPTRIELHEDQLSPGVYEAVS
jgi:hypothetical protein